MKSQAMILEDFFDDPKAIRKEIHGMDMVDHMAEDGVVYPGIVDLHHTHIAQKVIDTIRVIFPNARSSKTFARYSFQHISAPNWAHSDRDMTEMLALIYLNPRKAIPSTMILEHEDGFHTHPNTMVEKTILLEDSNETFKWQPRQVFKGHWNNCLILNADYIHGAGVSFGDTRDRARLVLTCFFDIDATIK